MDQLANHADGFQARVEVDVVFSSFLFEGSLFKDSGARDDWVTRFFCLFEENSRLFCPNCRSRFQLHTSRNYKHFLSLGRRKSSSMAESALRGRKLLERAECANRHSCAAYL